MPRAEAAARKALALDDGLAEAHASLAGVLYRYHWEWDSAGKEFQRSLELDPNYAEGHRAYAVYLVTLRRHEEAFGAARRARELSPLSAVINVELATTLWRLSRYDDAIEQLHKTLEINPNFSRAYVESGIISSAKGRPASSDRRVRTGRGAFRRAGPICEWLGYGYARRRPKARGAADSGGAGESVQRASTFRPTASPSSTSGSGRRTRRWDGWRRPTTSARSRCSSFAGPVFELLHDQPRFQDLLRRMGLARTQGYLSAGRG